MQKRLFLTAALLAACPLTAWAQDAAPATPAAPTAVTPGAASTQPVTLRLKFTPGQTQYYSMSMDIDGTVQSPGAQTPFPIKNHIDMLMHQKVKDVRATDGAATLESGIDTMTFSMNGQTFPLPQAQMVGNENHRDNRGAADRQDFIFHAEPRALRPVRHTGHGYEPYQLFCRTWSVAGRAD